MTSTDLFDLGRCRRPGKSRPSAVFSPRAPRRRQLSQPLGCPRLADRDSELVRARSRAPRLHQSRHPPQDRRHSAQDRGPCRARGAAGCGQAGPPVRSGTRASKRLLALAKLRGWAGGADGVRGSRRAALGGARRRKPRRRRGYSWERSRHRLAGRSRQLRCAMRDWQHMVPLPALFHALCARPGGLYVHADSSSSVPNVRTYPAAHNNMADVTEKQLIVRDATIAG